MSDPVTPSEKVQAWIEQGRELLAELTAQPEPVEVPATKASSAELRALQENHRELEEQVMSVWKQAVNEGWPRHFLNSLLPVVASVQGLTLTKDDSFRTADSNGVSLSDSREAAWEDWAKFHLYKRWQINPHDNRSLPLELVENILVSFATLLRVRSLAPAKRRAFLEWPLDIIREHGECFAPDSKHHWVCNLDAVEMIIEEPVEDMLKAVCRHLESLYVNYERYFKE